VIITKQGKDIKHVFKCAACLCTFECHQGELDSVDGCAGEIVTLYISSVTALCPNCGEVVVSKREIVDDS